MKRSSLDSLTGLRFLAALSVFAYHAHWLQVFQLGAVGVSFFFVLSGFIIFYQYHDRVSTPAEVRNFYVARSAKILPLYYILLVVSTPVFIWFLFPHMYHMSPAHAVSFLTVSGLLSVFMLQAWVPATPHAFLYPASYNPVAWSLCAEALFYALFPLLMRFYRRHNWFLSRPFIFGLWIVLGLGTLIAGNFPHSFRVLYFLAPARLPDFLIGMSVAAYAAKHPYSGRHPNTSETLLAFAFIIVTVTSVALPIMLQLDWVYLPLSVLIIYTFSRQGGVLSKLLSMRFPRSLGNASFSFYMIHYMILTTVQYAVSSSIREQFHIQTLILFLCILVSIVTYRLIEEPLRKQIRARYMKYPTPSELQLFKVTSSN